MTSDTELEDEKKKKKKDKKDKEKRDEGTSAASGASPGADEEKKREKKEKKEKKDKDRDVDMVRFPNTFAIPPLRLTTHHRHHHHSHHLFVLHLVYDITLDRRGKCQGEGGEETQEGREGEGNGKTPHSSPN